MVNLTGAAICICIFPIASAQLPNKAYLFGIYLLWGLGYVLVNQKYLIETNDKTREQIYSELKKIQDKWERIAWQKRDRNDQQIAEKILY